MHIENIPHTLSRVASLGRHELMQAELDSMVHGIWEHNAISTNPHHPDEEPALYEQYLLSHSMQASDINNQGSENQIEFLMGSGAGRALEAMFDYVLIPEQISA